MTTNRKAQFHRAADTARDAVRKERERAVERSRQPRADGEKFNAPLLRLYEFAHPGWQP